MEKLFRLCAIAFCFLISTHLFANTCVYEISKDKQKLYLVGTIHLLRPQDFPLPIEFESAYQQASHIVFETDLEKIKTPEFNRQLTQAMVLPDNKTLSDVLNSKTWMALNTYAANNQYPLKQTAVYNAAFNSILITFMATQKLGIGEGVDVYFDTKAQADQKQISGLESSDDVIQYMQSFAQENPDAIINSTLKDAENLSEEMYKLISAWRRGDLSTLDKEINKKMRYEMPVAYQSLVLHRNKQWLPEIEAMLATPEIEIVMVGALHLAGDQGLLSLLKKDGYTIKTYTVKP